MFVFFFIDWKCSEVKFKICPFLRRKDYIDGHELQIDRLVDWTKKETKKKSSCKTEYSKWKSSVTRI